MLQLLIIEDDSSVQLALKVFFEGKDYDVFVSDTGAEGMEIALKNLPDIILLDLRLPDAYGLNLLKEIKTGHPDSVVYIMTAYGEINEAIEAIRSGAENYFQKPIDLEELSAMVEKSSDLIKLRRELALYKKAPYPIVGRSRAVQGLMHMINLMAENHSTTLLIQGETGTGKELVARNIHALSIRENSPFVDINCAAIPDNILEGELFGYEPGAFTDAKSSKKGLLEIADKGTLFLDEIGDMSLGIQAKVLRVIETKTFRRLGGIKDIKVDVRVIAATNKDLKKALKEGSFREDLYYRLNVMPIDIPPLRERPEDIPLLAEFFLSSSGIRSAGKKLSGFEKGALDALTAYPWPGNIRELRNVVERAAILTMGEAIPLSSIILQSGPQKESTGAGQTIDEVVAAHIEGVLKSTGGNKAKAARILGIARSTLIEKRKACKIHDA